ncbi:Cytochrome P450 3A14 [Trichoplax sp. H2]|nr:Cytochrome P450 3A14 [Trichoplax sp. H2]|eukprot:RDD39453.1 Cytochrome P450 3A14 [Trichoplax sp. H2]
MAWYETILPSWRSPSTLTQSILISILGLVAYFSYKIYFIPKRSLKRLGIKHPSRSTPLFGNLLDYGATSAHIAQMEWQKQFGNVYATLFFHVPTIWVGDPEVLKSVLVKDFSNFANRKQLSKSPRPFNTTLLELRDMNWKRVRNILVPAFSASKLKAVIPIIQQGSDEFVEKLLLSEESNQKLDIWHTSGQFSMKIILAAGFGIEFESHEQEERLIAAAGALFRDFTGPSQLLVVLSPTLFDRLEPLIGNVVNSIKYITRITENVIQQRRQNLQNGIKCRKDIMQQMIEAGEDDKLNDEEIIGQAFLFLIAGYETTQNTLAFACYSLATNPDVQQKLIDEIDSKCPDPNDLNYDVIGELPYLEMVVEETLRMYPPTYFVNRDVKSNITVKGFHIPKDTMIGLPIYGIHHNSEFWPNHEQFIPERFTPEEKAKRNPYSYIPFGGGPRNCIGMRLALLEIKLALVKIIQNVEFYATKETEIPLQLKTGASLCPANGIYLGIRRRH